MAARVRMLQSRRLAWTGLAVVLAFVTAVLTANEWGWPGWLVGGLTAVTAIAVSAVDAKRRLTTPSPADAAGGDDPQPVRSRAVEPESFGLADSVRRRGRASLPTYVRRDAHDALHRMLGAAEKKGGLIVLVGPPGSGRSRLAYEVVRERSSQRDALFFSVSAGSLARVAAPPGPAVIWLDDISDIAGDPNSLTVARLRELRPAVVIGTLWPSEYDELSRTGPSGERGPAAELLRKAVKLDVRSKLSPKENERAAMIARTDRHVRLAWRSSRETGYGMTQTLAVAPGIRDRWERTVGAERAVLTAAIDATRMGARAPLSKAFLGAAAKGYLSQADERTLSSRSSWLTDAIDSAASPPNRGSGAGLLRWSSPDALVPADYLRLIGAEKRATRRAPASFWSACAHHVTDARDLRVVGRHALRYGFDADAEAIWRAASRAGDVPSALELAALFGVQGRHEDRLRILRAVAPDSPDGRRLLTDELITSTHLPKAEQRHQLATVEKLWRNDATPSARLALAGLLEDVGRADEALAVLRDAVDAGLPDAEAQLALLLGRLDRDDEVEEFWRSRGQAGVRQLAALLTATDRVREAETLLLSAIADTGTTAETAAARTQLADIYLAAGRGPEAEALLRLGVRAGESTSRIRLVALLSGTDRDDEADELLVAAPPDDFRSRDELINRLVSRSDPGAAERYCREGLAAGDPQARIRLCDALSAQGRFSEAMEVWAEAIDFGDPSARSQQAQWLLGLERVEEAEHVLVEAMDSGAGDAQVRELLDGLTLRAGAPSLTRGLRPPERDPAY